MDIIEVGMIHYGMIDGINIQKKSQPWPSLRNQHRQVRNSVLLLINGGMLTKLPPFFALSDIPTVSVLVATECGTFRLCWWHCVDEFTLNATRVGFDGHNRLFFADFRPFEPEF